MGVSFLVPIILIAGVLVVGVFVMMFMRKGD